MSNFRVMHLLTAAVFAGAVGLAAAPASAQVPRDLLELDGNTADGGLFPSSFDWDNAAAQPVVGLFVDDVDGLGGLSMTQGTKDNQDISDWVFKQVAKTSPGKDELLRSRAAQVTDPGTGDFILYLAAERAEASGTTTFGFWVLGGDVEIDPSDGNSFSDDQHTEDDILVVVDVNGNVIEGVRIFQWLGGDGTAGSLVETVMVGEANCDAVGTINGGDDFNVDICGAVSADGLFLEVGINFAVLFPEFCIADLMATTRTSNQPTASVKNFTFNDFGTCGITATGQCSLFGDGLSDDFSMFEFQLNGDVTSDFGTLFDVDVFDDVTLDGPTPDDVIIASFVSVGTTPVNWGPVVFQSPTNGPVNQIYAVAAVVSGGPQTIVSDVDSANCPALSISAALSVTKVCRACLTVDSGMVAVTVLAAGTVCNQGDLPLQNVSVRDDHGTVDPSDDEIVSVADIPVGECRPYATAPFKPATVNSANPGAAVFTDIATASATTALGVPVLDQASPEAMCELCPDGGDSSGIACPALP